MKAKHLLLISLLAALPGVSILAEDTGKSPTPSEQSATGADNKTATGKDQMTCNCNRADTELDKLVAEMNNAPVDKKVDAIAAVVTKLAEKSKATQQETKKKTAADEKSSMGMCEMMMGMNMKDKGDNQEGDHAHHH